MALKKTKNYKGISISNAYHKLHEMRIHPTDEDGVFSVHFSVELKSTKSTPQVCIQRSEVYKFDYDLESIDNALKQAYNYLKTLEEFDGAVDA